MKILYRKVTECKTPYYQEKRDKSRCGGVYFGHSLRVGSAVSLAQAGASVVDMQVAGRWKSSQMPAHYARAEIAERGAIARYKRKAGKTITR